MRKAKKKLPMRTIKNPPAIINAEVLDVMCRAMEKIHRILVENGHAEDGAGGIGAGGGIGHVVGADDQGDIGLRQVAIDLVHFDEPVVGDVGFGEQHVHVAGHASGDGMDGEADVDALLGEHVIEFADFVLGLRDGHAVAGDDDDLIAADRISAASSGVALRTARSSFAPAADSLHLAEGSEHHVGEGAVHRLAHDDRENEAGRSVERAGDDQHFAVEDKSQQGSGKAGVGIQQRDDGGHVGAADRSDQQDAEDQRDDRP